MGNFYTNFTIFNSEAEQVAIVAKDLNRRAYIVQSGNDVVFYDQVCDQQNDNEITTLGTALSLKLKSRILGCLNHDDDQLLLWVFEPDNKKSHYASITDAPRFAWFLARYRGGVLTYPFVLMTLAWPIFVFEIFRHSVLKAFLSLPAASVGFGYEYISKGETPPGISPKDIRQIW